MRIVRNSPLLPLSEVIGGSENTSLDQYNSSVDFPAVGQENILYIDKSSVPYSVYVWDADTADYIQIGGSGTGTGSIVYEDSVADLPATGNADTLYVITGGVDFIAYVWSTDDLTYKAISSSGGSVAVGGEPTGFNGITSTISLGSLTGYNSTYEFDANESLFTIVPTTEQSIYVNAQEFVKTSSENVIVNANGLSYIYYDTDGVLRSKSTYFNFKTEAPVAYVYRHNNRSIVLAEERHGLVMDWATHEYLHETRGAAYANGFAITNYTLNGDGTSASDLTIGLTGGSFFDEDLKINIVHGAGGYFTQPLNGVAQIPVFYRTGSGWAADKATDYPLKSAATMQYNQLLAGNWTLNTIPNNGYGVMFIVATNNLLAPIIAIMGQQQYSEQTAAEASFYSALDLSGFPIYEFRPLYKLIYRTRSSYTNDRKAVLRGVHDLRREFSAVLSAPIENSHPYIKSMGRVATTADYEQEIVDSAVTSNNVIMVDFENDGPVISYSIKERNDGVGFTVKFASIPPAGSFINYQII